MENNQQSKNMNTAFEAKDHCFVICAYKENPFLEETIQSLFQQTVKSNIQLATSTPNEYIKSLCAKYDIPMFVNEHPKNIASDWNFAYDSAKSALVTIVHQDDKYEPKYLEQVLKKATKNFMICFTDYYEIKLDKAEMSNMLLKIKRLMAWPLSKKVCYASKFIRRKILSFGCPICCPSVTLHKAKLGKSVFDTRYVNSCDYKTWSDLSKLKGDFVYINQPLMAHRIYAESTTTLNLKENIRQKEDLEIFESYWIKPIAKMINKVYATSEKSNKTE